MGAGDASVVDYGFSVVNGADDAANNAFGISISTDGVDGQANVFEDPERCDGFRALFFGCSPHSGALSFWLTSSVPPPFSLINNRIPLLNIFPELHAFITMRIFESEGSGAYSMLDVRVACEGSSQVSLEQLKAMQTAGHLIVVFC